MLKQILIGFMFAFLLTVPSDLFASYDATFNRTCVIYSAPQSHFTDPKPQRAGNSCTVLEEQNDWCKIVYDSEKIGWVKKSDITPFYFQSSGPGSEIDEELVGNPITSENREEKYQEALSYRNKGDYPSALALFNALGNYKQSDIYYRASLKEYLLSISLGSVIRFGRFFGNDLEWFVLEKNSDSVLLFCKYAFIDKYDEKGETISWSSCSLKKTLNGVFYEQAFSALQKECIMEVKTDQTWSSKKANSDKVFLLCQRDIEKNNFIMRNAILPHDDRPFWLRVPINDGFDGSGKNKGKAKYYDCKFRHDFAICDQRSMLVVRPAIRIPVK